jgi:hypothetical protein
MQARRVDGRAALIVALAAGRAQVPYFDRAVLAGSKHPFRVLLEPDGSHVARVPVETRDLRRIARIDFVQTHVRVARHGQVLLVGRDLESVDLLGGGRGKVDSD